MSLGSRIKERREQLHISRYELAFKIGVTHSAISNYENGVSSPRTETLVKLCNILDCDVNYLFQDEMIQCNHHHATPSEMILIKKYRTLDTYGKEIIDIILEKEFVRVSDTKTRLEHYASLLKATFEHSDCDPNNKRKDGDPSPWQN